MFMDSTLIDDVVARWHATNAWPEPGVAPERLDAFEAKHHVRLPRRFRALYERVNGTHGDENLLRFYPLDEIRPLAEEDAVVRRLVGSWPERGLPDAESYFVFADYMIFSHVYALRLSPPEVADPNPVLWVLSGTQHEEIASCFDEFLAMYDDDADSILFPPSTS